MRSAGPSRRRRRAARRRRRSRRCRRPCLVHATEPSCASTQPTAAWNERAQTRSPTRTTGPTRSARRSTSFAPRGEPSGTSQRSADVVGSKPAIRGPWPTTSVFLNAASTPVCASISGSPGRCTCQSLTPSAASKACTERSTPSTKMRPPATSGAVATRTASGILPLHLRAFERDQIAFARDDGDRRAVAADSRRDLAADVGAPEHAARLGFEREHRAVARAERQHVAVDGDGERKLDRADADVPHLPHRDRRSDRLELLGRRLFGAEQGAEERAAREQDRRGRSAGARRAARRARSGHFVASAPLAALAAGWTPSRFSLASIRRR